MMIEIAARPIDAAAFAPFGQIVDCPDGQGRVNFAATVENRRPAARTNLACVRPPVTDLPVTVDRMERHPFSTQAFLPLDVSRYLVIVAPTKDGGPDAAGIIAFTVPAGIGISYLPDVWHCGMLLLDRPGTLAMLVHEDGSPDDCIYHPVPPFVVVV
ncbi:MAG: ureidoglycolate lyase [Ancalomicrobiaceae bacterium]|nr:ureidoglycolate lyase [Ancalomicrobiaceae bacterium]